MPKTAYAERALVRQVQPIPASQQTITQLPPLEILEKDITSRLYQNRVNKRLILKNLLLIYENRYFYFDAPPLQKYREDFVSYIVQRFDQNLSTAYDDKKIIELLLHHHMQQLLDEDHPGLIRKLKLIAQLSSLNRQGEYLETLPSLSVKDIRQDTRPVVYPLITLEKLEIKQRFDPKKGRLLLKGRKEVLEKISKLLGYLDEVQLGKLLALVEKK